MVRVKTSDLEGAALNYCVDYIVTGKWPDACDDGHVHAPDYAGDWSQGGPLIDEYRPSLHPICNNGGYVAEWSMPTGGDDFDVFEVKGPTPLIAACRSVIEAHLGFEIDIPEELV